MMRRIHPQLSVRWLMTLVAVVGLGFGLLDLCKTWSKANRYRRKAAGAARMERRCRAIDAMDRVQRKAEADYLMDDPYSLSPEWNRRMIPYFQMLRLKYEAAAAHPREPVPPEPPAPE